MDQKDLNELHATRPQKGDYWHELLTPICIIVGEMDGKVTLCRHKSYIGVDYWEWDWSRVESIPKEAFRKWIVERDRAAVKPHRMLRDVLMYEDSHGARSQRRLD